MEDPRISRMYLAMLERAAGRAGANLKRMFSSSVTWIVLLVLALIGSGIAIHEKGRGHLHQLKEQLGAEPTVPAEPPPQPGGRAPIILTHAQQMDAIAPEFHSATLLPGRGLNILQITAYLPGKGEVPLLDAPSLADAARAMTGIESDSNGWQSLLMGAAIEVPWAGQISGAALPGGTSLLANWQGRGLSLPVNSTSGNGIAVHSAVGGLLLKSASDSVSTSTGSEGEIARTTFNADNFNGHWPSKTEVKTTVRLDTQALELTVVARNTGSDPEPMGIGWLPRFAIPAGQRAQMLLRIPSNLRTETQNGLQTGRLLPVEKTDLDFTSPGGSPLGTISLNDTFVHLKAGAMSADPEVELRNPAAGYGLRLIAMSPSIKAIHIDAPADKPIISINPQSNYDDPLGREWNEQEGTGFVVLQPGQSLQWKIRLEIFPLSAQKPISRN